MIITEADILGKSICQKALILRFVLLEKFIKKSLIK